MIGCLWTHVRKQPIIALYFESENELKFYNLEARSGPFSLSFSSFSLPVSGMSPDMTELLLTGTLSLKLNQSNIYF